MMRDKSPFFARSSGDIRSALFVAEANQVRAMPRSHGDYSGEKPYGVGEKLCHDETESGGSLSTIKCGLRHFGKRRNVLSRASGNGIPLFFLFFCNMQISYELVLSTDWTCA